MIDGIKLLVPSQDGQYWRKNSTLDFRGEFDSEVPEINLAKKNWHYSKGLYLTIKESENSSDGFIYLLNGSIAKYWNEGIDNAFDYSLNDFQNTLIELNEHFNINPYTSLLQNIEFGVNIELNNISTKEYCDSLIAYKNKPIRQQKGGQIQMNIGERYVIKIYDKSTQSDLPSNNILRFEIAYKKMSALNKRGIHYLSDVLELKSHREWMGKRLLEVWDSLLYYDYGVDESKIKGDELNDWLRYKNPYYWKSICSQKRRRAKQHFYSLKKKYGASRNHQIIREQIQDKWNYLAY